MKFPTLKRYRYISQMFRLHERRAIKGFLRLRKRLWRERKRFVFACHYTTCKYDLWLSILSLQSRPIVWSCNTLQWNGHEIRRDTVSVWWWLYCRTPAAMVLLVAGCLLLRDLVVAFWANLYCSNHRQQHPRSSHFSKQYVTFVFLCVFWSLS